MYIPTSRAYIPTYGVSHGTSHAMTYGPYYGMQYGQGSSPYGGRYQQLACYQLFCTIVGLPEEPPVDRLVQSLIPVYQLIRLLVYPQNYSNKKVASQYWLATFLFE